MRSRVRSSPSPPIRAVDFDRKSTALCLYLKKNRVYHILYTHSFVVNNPECKGIVIGETTIPVLETPFVYYYPFIPNEYYFIDANGNELS